VLSPVLFVDLNGHLAIAWYKKQYEGMHMIQGYSFGRMTVEGQAYHHDLKIIRGQVVMNWRRREGHGLDADDVEDILHAKPSVLVVGTGYSGQMRVRETLRSILAESKMELIAEPTMDAIRTFNRLIDEGKDVAGAFHLTC
jgi:hypothetical protein